MSQPPSAGQYSPDGQWYWDGRQWVPAQQAPQPQWAQPVQPAPQPRWAQPTPQQPPFASPAPPRRRRGPLKFILIALAVIVALVVCSIGGVVLVFLNSQGIVDLPLLPPSAAAILAKPLQGGLQDAAVHETINDKQKGDVTTAQGAITFSPKIAMKLTYTAPGGQNDELWADGLHYGRAAGPWQIEPGSQSSDLSFLGWADTTLGRNSGTVVGEETLPQGTCWHVKDIGGYDEFWIRESDGFPIKVESERAFVHASYTFDSYNQGVTISAPTGSDVETAVTRGQVGQTIDAGTGTVKVSQVQNPYSGGGKSDPGYRKIALHLTYTSTSSGGSSLKLLALNDSRGHVAGPFPTPGSAPSPAFPVTNGGVQSGQSVDGWVSFEVKDDAQGLVLQVGGQVASQQTFMILVSV